MTKKSPLELPGLLVTDEILEGILEQTNLFAEQFIESHELPCHSQVQQWRTSSPHDVDELRKFLALMLLWGSLASKHQGCLGYNMAFCNFHLQLHHDVRHFLPHPTISSSERQ